MSFWKHILILGWLCGNVAPFLQSQTCNKFPASFLAVVNQDTEAVILDDPDLTFLKEIMNFRDDTIQHTIDDVINFFNESYGLDFSLSPPNEKNEYFYQNAKLSPFELANNIEYLVVLNNWIQTGSTRSTCYKIRDGGFRAIFSAQQTLYGTYGGSGAKTVGETDSIFYGFYSIEVCEQSPVIIQYQSGSPFRFEPVDSTGIINCDLYSRVLGHGKAQGIFKLTPSPNAPGKQRLVIQNAFTFPA